MTLLRYSCFKNVPLIHSNGPQISFSRCSSSFVQKVQNFFRLGETSEEIKQIEKEFSDLHKKDHILTHINMSGTGEKKPPTVSQPQKSVSTTTHTVDSPSNSKQTVDVTQHSAVSVDPITPLESTKTDTHTKNVNANNQMTTFQSNNNRNFDLDAMRRRVQESLKAGDDQSKSDQTAMSKLWSSMTTATSESDEQSTNQKTLADSIKSIKSNLPENFASGTYFSVRQEEERIRNIPVPLIKPVQKIRPPVPSKVEKFTVQHQIREEPAPIKIIEDELAIKLKNIIRDCKRTMFEYHQIDDMTRKISEKFRAHYPEGSVLVSGGSAFNHAILGDIVVLLTDSKEEKMDKSSVVSQINCVKTCLTQLGLHFNQVKNNPQIIHITDNTKQFVYLIYVGSTQRLAIRYLMDFYHSMDSRLADLIMLVKIWVRSYPENKKFGALFSDDAITMMALHFLQNKKILPNLHKAVPEKVNLENIFKVKSTDFPQLPHQKNNSNIYELFEEFIRFYGKINWKRTAIDIRTGKLVGYQNKAGSRNNGNIIEPFSNNGFFNIGQNDEFTRHLKVLFDQTLVLLNDPESRKNLPFHLSDFK